MHTIDLQREGFHAARAPGRGALGGPAIRSGCSSSRRSSSSVAVRRAPARRRTARGARARAAARRQRPVARVVRGGGPADHGAHRRRVQRRRADAPGRRAESRPRARRASSSPPTRLREGRLVRLSPVSITHAEAQPYHLVYPPVLRDWPPLASFRTGSTTRSPLHWRPCADPASPTAKLAAARAPSSARVVPRRGVEPTAGDRLPAALSTRISRGRRTAGKIACSPGRGRPGAVRARGAEGDSA